MGDWLWRTDGDFVFDPTLIAEAISTKADAVIVPGTSDGSISLWAETHRREREVLMGDVQHAGPSFVNRKVYDKLGGYNEKLWAYEDYDHHNRIRKAGFKITMIKSRAYHLGEPAHLKEVVPKYLYYGDRKNVDAFKVANPDRKFQLLPFRPVYLKNIRKFGLYFFPFLVFLYVRYVAATVGYYTS